MSLAPTVLIVLVTNKVKALCSHSHMNSFASTGRSSFKPYNNGSHRNAVRSRSRRSREDGWQHNPFEAESATATTSGLTSSVAPSSGSRSSKRHHRSSTSSAASATLTAPSAMGGSVSSKLQISIHIFKLLGEL